MKALIFEKLQAMRLTGRETGCLLQKVKAMIFSNHSDIMSPFTYFCSTKVVTNTEN